MLALYRCGCQEDALPVYRELRDRLMSELGLQASDELRRLEHGILRHDAELVGPKGAPPRIGSPSGVLPL